MKNRIYSYLILILLSLMFLFQSCDKMDKNGDLDGHWQMTDWRNNADNSVVADKSSQLFYTIQLELIQIRYKTKEKYGCVALFEHRNDSLILTKAFQQKANTDSLLQDMSTLKKYGVSADGRFKIVSLSSDHMTLKNDEYTLKFLKY